MEDKRVRLRRQDLSTLEIFGSEIKISLVLAREICERNNSEMLDSWWWYEYV